jgi:hypothetical protein
MTWKVTNSQDYAPKYIKYIIDTEAVTPGTVDYNFDVLAGTVDVDWGDGTSSTGLTTGVTTHTYASAGKYTVTITQNGTNTFRPDIGLQEISVQHKPIEGGDNFWNSSLYRMAYFASNLKEWAYTDFTGVTSLEEAWSNCTSLTSFPSITAPNVTDASIAWSNCTSFTTFPAIDFPICSNFLQAWKGCSSMTSFGACDLSQGTFVKEAWRGCTSLTSFPAIDFPLCPRFDQAWQTCNNLTTFPAIDLGSQAASTVNMYRAWYGNSSLTSWGACNTSNAYNIEEAWYDNVALTSFPVVDFSSVTNARSAWQNCTSLTSFPAIDFPVCTNFYRTWRNCSSLTTFPLIDVSSGTDFRDTWRTCSSLATFPANMFDSATATNYTNAFYVCALTAASVENILVSIDTSGVSNGTLGISGGTTAGQASWTTAATTAYNSLVTKGWTITANP